MPVIVLEFVSGPSVLLTLPVYCPGQARLSMGFPRQECWNCLLQDAITYSGLIIIAFYEVLISSIKSSHFVTLFFFLK